PVAAPARALVGSTDDPTGGRGGRAGGLLAGKRIAADGGQGSLTAALGLALREHDDTDHPDIDRCPEPGRVAVGEIREAARGDAVERLPVYMQHLGLDGIVRVAVQLAVDAGLRADVVAAVDGDDDLARSRAVVVHAQVVALALAPGDPQLLAVVEAREVAA